MATNQNRQEREDEEVDGAVVGIFAAEDGVERLICRRHQRLLEQSNVHPTLRWSKNKRHVPSLKITS